jgi:hypothetical protein
VAFADEAPLSFNGRESNFILSPNVSRAGECEMNSSVLLLGFAVMLRNEEPTIQAKDDGDK